VDGQRAAARRHGALGEPCPGRVDAEPADVDAADAHSRREAIAVGLVDDVGGRDDAAGDEEQDAAEDQRPALPESAPESPGREAAVADRRAHAHQGATREGADVHVARTGHPRPGPQDDPAGRSRRAAVSR
jgi:hypothetical protein